MLKFCYMYPTTSMSAARIYPVEPGWHEGVCECCGAGVATDSASLSEVEEYSESESGVGAKGIVICLEKITDPFYPTGLIEEIKVPGGTLYIHSIHMFTPEHAGHDARNDWDWDEEDYE